MSVTPELEAAADTYTNQPIGHPNYANLFRIAERDAFIAGAEWAQGHPTNGNQP